MTKTTDTQYAANQSLESPITIGFAETAKEREEIFHFRYHIYAEEMGKSFPCMDHLNKYLHDELDEQALLLYAEDNGNMVGTLRLNIATIRQFPDFWVNKLSLNRFLPFVTENQNIAYASKFLIADSHRNSTLPYLLSANSYELYCRHQVQFTFCVANLHLVRLYEQFGFHRYSHNFTDPGYGLLAPFVLLVDDIEHFHTVRSPFFRLARKRTSLNSQTRAWFCAEFPEYSKSINSQLITADALWLTLNSYLESRPVLSIPLLHGLDEEAAKKFLHHCAVIVHCQTGDQITVKHDSSHALYTLLSGKLHSPDLHSAALLRSGDHFGAAGLICQERHPHDMFAATDCDILVLTSLAFPKFRHANPNTAEKIINNLRHIFQPSSLANPPE